MITRENILEWLTEERFARLPKEAREEALEQVLKTAPDAPTAGVWILQRCCIMPSEDDLTRWSCDVAALKAKVTQRPAKKHGKK